MGELTVGGGYNDGYFTRSEKTLFPKEVMKHDILCSCVKTAKDVVEDDEFSA